MDETLLAQLPNDLTVDIDGKSTPLREVPFVKESPDFKTFAKTAYDAHREVGSRIPIKVDTSKPENIKAWRDTHIPILRKNGLLPTPPSSHTEYGVARPSDMPEGLQWSEERAEKFSKLLHKYEVPKEMAAELVELQKDALLQNVNFVKTTMDQGIQALKTEYGDKYESMVEDVKRLTSRIFKTPDELSLFTVTGLANHPAFLSVMMRLAQVAKGDSSFLKESGGGGTGSMTGEEAREELAKIMNDKTHAMHDGYHRGDKNVMAHIDEIYKKAYGDGKVVL